MIPRILLGVATAASTLLTTPLRAAELGIRQDAGLVQLTLPGEDGKEYSLEAIQSFLDGSRWEPVATVAPTNRPVLLYDPTCTTRPQNFYRLRLLQGAVPVEVPNFRLLDLEGVAHELFYQSDTRCLVLVFAGKDPASLQPHLPGLRNLAATHHAPNLRLWIVADATHLDRERWRAAFSEFPPGTVVLADEGGVVTREFNDGLTPSAVVLKPGLWKILYRGRIADRIDLGGTTREQQFLADAVEQHLAEKGVLVRFARAEPTPGPQPGSAGPDYARDIVPLLQKHCVRCHSPGNIAPWAMTDHAIVQQYAPLMKDEVLTRRMPPWHADPGPQRFANDAMLPPQDMERLVQWINLGAPRGDGADPLAAAVPPPPPEWPLGTPDRIIPVETQQIPAAGTVDYRYVLVRNPFPNDVWLRAAVVRPGNARVVHHVLVFGASSFADILEIQAGLGGYFAAYVPGMDQVPFPPGTAKLLKKGAFFVFQLHYTSMGEATTDSTQLGLYLAPERPQRELRTAAAYTTSFTIPPGDPNYPATAEFRMPRNGILYELSPHMHYRGRWFRFDAIYPDNRRETLLHVPFYRFDWQTLYRLAEPKPLPAGTRIVATGGWDNSARNPYNPDASAAVGFGEQSWEEMFIGYFNWAEDN